MVAFADVGPARNVPQETVVKIEARQQILVTLDDVKKRNITFT